MRTHFQNISYDTFFLWSYSSDFTVMKPVIYILLTGEDEEWTEIMKNQKVFQLVWIDKRERYIAQRIFTHTSQDITN